jgi:hypothetical protein
LLSSLTLKYSVCNSLHLNGLNVTSESSIIFTDFEKEVVEDNKKNIKIKK